MFVNMFLSLPKHMCLHAGMRSRPRCKHAHLSILLILSNWKLIQRPSREIDKELMKGKRVIKSNKEGGYDGISSRQRDWERGGGVNIFFFFWLI